MERRAQATAAQPLRMSIFKGICSGKIRSQSGLPLKRFAFQRVHSAKKRGYRCCRSPYGPVVAKRGQPFGLPSVAFPESTPR
ncbi:MAG: hypothetical protein ACLU98_12580, partial [Desulfovibrio fairfieldensis]